MDVRTFEAFTLRDAIKAVKQEFGKDAVILKTREKMQGPGKRMFEVTAAAPSARSIAGATTTNADDSATEVRQAIQNLGSRIGMIQEKMVASEQAMALESGIRELKFILIETLRKRDGSKYSNLPEEIGDLVRQLEIMGVEDARLTDLIKYLGSLPTQDMEKNKDESAAEYYKDQSVRWLLKRVKVAPRWDILSGSLSVHCLVGTTGVGKSTSVAKLAAHYHLKEKKKVLVASLDNQRLAASDQMRIYCKILGIPFELLSEPGELAAAISRHHDTELVLVDTAGRSPKNPRNLDELIEFKGTQVPIDFHLVLALTEKEDQLDRSVRCFSKLGLQSILFTKLDETWTYGEIFNVSTRWGVPLSYFGTGQAIPEDIERASRERVVERIFGL